MAVAKTEMQIEVELQFAEFQFLDGSAGALQAIGVGLRKGVAQAVGGGMSEHDEVMHAAILRYAREEG